LVISCLARWQSNCRRGDSDAANLRDSSDDHRRPRGALASLAPHLLNALIDEALVIARKISEP
jgi:hypothetical protein